MDGAELAEMYSKITAGGCTHVGPIEVAEAAKMVENTQRILMLIRQRTGSGSAKDES